jgi:hypothetical protein
MFSLNNKLCRAGLGEGVWIINQGEEIRMKKSAIEKLKNKYPLFTPSQVLDYYQKNKPNNLKNELKKSILGKKIILKGKIIKIFKTGEEIQSGGKSGEVAGASSVGFGPMGAKLSFEREYLIGDKDNNLKVVKVKDLYLKEEQEVMILGYLLMTKENFKVEFIKLLEK